MSNRWCAVVRCFVVGPIGNKFAPLGDPGRQSYEDSLQVFEEVIQAACQQVGIDPVRADQIAVAGEITEQVFRHLFEDDVVIADVSGGNPNVMYELGLRHATGKLTIQIGEFGQLPFDVNTVRTIQFSRSPRGLIDARNQLERALQAGLLDGQDVLTATRIFQESGEGKAEIDLPLPEPSIEVDGSDDEPGFLDNMIEIENQLALMTDNADGVASSIEVIGAVTESVGAELERAAQSGASNSARLALISKYASEISEPVEMLEKSSADFASNMTSINDGVLSVLGVIQNGDPSELPEGWDGFLDQLIGMAESSREGMEGLNTFGTAAEGLGSLSRQLRGPGRKINNSVGNMRKAIAKIDAWERAARSIKHKAANNPVG
ncbi:hypothetical protein [Streptomyces sp. NPDC087300]|uniref:hypothetical protein n=1 Tax=Streptomyces sp. NPDC087300 TaxID=3365780 RepID=UPI0037F1F39A